MSTPDALDRLQTFLCELFRLDCASLDFGVYRIVNSRRQAIEGFIQHDLVGLVASAAGEGHSKPTAAVDFDASVFDGMLTEAFNHLYRFFSRYYEKGNFVSRNYYGCREGYVIPRDGGEVYLYWVNSDQYYVTSGECSSNHRLKRSLRRCVRQNASDLFIHKDLKGFLTRELDFYLKNEVLNLDELEDGNEQLLKGLLRLVRAIRNAGGKIIELLAQIEDFQKMLFEKRKFITDVEYCVTLKNVSEKFYPEIAGCEAQWSEWKELLNTDWQDNTPSTDLSNSAISCAAATERRVAFLKAHPTLMLDTRFFTQDFKDRLLGSYDDLDEMIDGLLVGAENFQALNLLQEKYRNRVRCIYIDPPYNTGNDGFVYNDTYQHSSWLSMMNDRLALAREFLCHKGVIYASIDDNEERYLAEVLGRIYGYLIGKFVWHKKTQPSYLSRELAVVTEYILAAKRAEEPIRLFGGYGDKEKPVELINISNEVSCRIFPKEHTAIGGSWTGILRPGEYGKAELKTVLLNEVPVNRGRPEVDLRVKSRFKWSQDKIDKELSRGARILIRNLQYLRPVLVRQFGPGEEVVKAPVTLLSKKINGIPTNTDADSELKGLFGVPPFDYSKPSGLLEFLINTTTDTESGMILDFFAGSGTTGHAVINLNRKDGKRRKFILAEVGNHFDVILLPRIKKIVFTPEWKEGNPRRQATTAEIHRSPRIIKYIRLEGYEDALNNILQDTVEFRGLKQQRGQQTLDFGADSQDAAEIQRPQGELCQQVLETDHYALKYRLNWETPESPVQLSLGRFVMPFSYHLVIAQKQGAHGKAVDVAETFAYLLGLHIKTRRVYRDGDRRYLVYKGEIDNRQVVVIWRETVGWREEDYKRERDFVLGHELTEGAEEILVNGDSLIPNAHGLDEVFKTKMFVPVVANPHA